MRKIILPLAAMLSIFIASSAMAAPMVMKLAAGDPKNSEMGVVGEAFKEYVEKESKGAIEVQTFYASALGDETETIHNLRAGTLDFAIVGIANLVPFAKPLGLLTLPYLFSNLDEVVVATNGKPAALLNTYAKKGGFSILTWTYTDFRYITNSKRPITKMADVKGLKFRVPQSAVLLAAYKSWGASPVPISWAETFTSLQQGVVDGQCYGYIGTKAMKFMEANQKYLTEVHYTYQLQPLIMSERIMKKLSPENQELMIEAGKVAQEAVLEYQISEASAAKADLVAAGLIVSQLEDEDEWKKVSIAKVWPEMADFVGGKKAINEFLAACGRPLWNN